MPLRRRVSRNSNPDTSTTTASCDLNISIYMGDYKMTRKTRKKQKNKHIERMQELNPDALKIDGHDNAIIGIVMVYPNYIFLYSMRKIITNLEKDMSHIDALDYYEFNIAGAYMGECTPAIMEDMDDD